MEFTVNVEDRVGALRDVAKAVSGTGANITAISSEVFGGRGLLHVVTEDESTARDGLKAAGFKFDETDVLKVSMDNKPGELAKYATKFADAGVNVRAVYLLGTNGDTTHVAFTVDDLEKARQAL